MRRSARVTSFEAAATTSFSVRLEFCWARRARRDVGVSVPEEREEKSRVRSASLARSALCLAVSCALRY